MARQSAKRSPVTSRAPLTNPEFRGGLELSVFCRRGVRCGGVLCRRSAYYVVLTARGVLLAECACGVREAWRAPGPVPWARHERVMKAGAALLLSCHGLLCAMGIVLETSHVCSRYEIRLRCDTDHLVAVHEAFFASGSQSQPWPATPDCEPKTRDSDRPPCVEDLRQALNSRCSGAVHCLFVLSRDHADRRCRGDGSLVVRYRCLPEKRVNKLCSVPLRQREGYLSSPGFPHYYPALTDCVWHLEAAQGQTVHVQMLDVSMRRPAPGPQDCVQDLVSVSEGSNPLLVACGEELRNLRSVQSVSNRLEVRFRASEFVPNRGFLLRYRLVGCPTPGPPHQGYLVHRTPSSAEYKCCRDHVFADTLRDTRTLHCVDGNAWNDSVPDCVSRLELALNGTLLAAEDDPGASDQALKHRSEMHLSSLADILVPCLIMGGLLLGNAVVVLVIFRLRKRRIARLRARLPTVALLADGESKEPPPAQRPQA